MKSFVQKAVIFAIVMLLVLAGGWMGRKMYRRTTQHRLLTEATEYAAKKDYKDALLCLRRSIQINPYGVEAHRMMADLLESLNTAASVEWREGVVRLQDNTTNRLAWAHTAINFKNYVAAAAALRGIEPDARGSEEFHKLAGVLDWSVGRLYEAETNYLEAYRLDPTNQTIAMNLAIVHMSSTNRAVAEAARASLVKIPPTSNLWPAAVHELLSDAILHKHLQQALGYSQEIVESPTVNFEDKVQRLSLLRVAKDPGFDAWMASLKMEAVKSPPSAYVLGQWLLSSDGAPQALAWLQSLPTDIQTNQPVPLIITDSQIVAKDWKGLLALTDQQDWDEMNYYRFALQSYAQSKLDQRYASENSWRKALQKASHQLTRLHGLSEVTGKWAWGEQRLQVLSEIMDEFPNELWARDQYASELYRQGRTKELGDFFAKLYAKAPDDLRLANDVANLNLLQGTDLPESHRLAKQVYDSATNDPSYATTYAYSLYLQGRTDDALNVLANIKPDYLQNPSIAAYYGYIEAKCGHKDRAREPIHLITEVQAAAAARSLPPVLLPEELQLVRSAQATL